MAMKCRLIETMLLNDDRPIGDGALGCIHIERAKSRVVSSHALDLHRAVWIESEVHRFGSSSGTISTVITREMDDRDWFT